MRLSLRLIIVLTVAALAIGIVATPRAQRLDGGVRLNGVTQGTSVSSVTAASNTTPTFNFLTHLTSGMGYDTAAGQVALYFNGTKYFGVDGGSLRAYGTSLTFGRAGIAGGTTADAASDSRIYNSSAKVWTVDDNAGGVATLSVVGTTTTSSAYQVAGVPTIVYAAGNFTTAANTNLQTITGLSWTLPASTALNIPFRCVLFYSQATAAVADSFGLQTATVTPTNFQAGGSMETALGTTAYGDVTIADTTATAVVTGTPSAIGTIFNAYVDGFLENPSNASTTAVNVMVKTSASADVITVYRGSFCRAF